MQQPPDHKVPTRPMPQPAQRHRDHQIQIRHHRVPLPRQRKEQIVPQPIRQTDMPPPPEIVDIRRQIRLIEIHRQLQPQQRRRPDRDIAISRKIEIQLQRVRIDPRQHLRPRIQSRKIEYPVHQVLPQIIGDEQLFHQPHANQK